MTRLLTIPFVFSIVFSFAQEEPSLNNFKGTRGNGLNFIANKGQIIDAGKNLRPDILFVGDGCGAKVYLRKKGISYVISNANVVLGTFRKQHKKEIKLKRLNKEFEKLQETYLKEHPITTQRIDVDFEGANENFTVLNEEATEGYTNYYYPHCKDGITFVKAYNKITYQNIYNDIDIVFYGNKSNGLKYDIIVRPGADPNNIKLLYSGANSLKLKGDSLQIETEIFTMKDYMPSVYQNINGEQADIRAKYNLKKLKHKKYEVTYQFENYDNTKALVIDPYNFWITYYGGSGIDYPADICNDNNGDVLITGNTYSSDFPVSFGAFQTSTFFGGPFILKMSNFGIRLWCTYYTSLDSFNNDVSYGISHDNLNNVFITGAATSNLFPVSAGCYQNILNGYQDAFLLKFDLNGLRIWATYFGGNGGEIGYSIACNTINEIIITGTVDSSAFIITGGVVQPVYGGGGDCFVSKFSSSGNLIWSTFFGGNGGDTPWHIKTDAFDNIIFSGVTFSSNYPVSTGCFQNILKNFQDGFITKINNSGTSVVFSTFLGGNELGFDWLVSITIDSKNNILAIGFTDATNFPVTSGAYQSVYGGGAGDNYIAKFSPSGVIKWCTYYGNSYWEAMGSIQCDNKDNVLVLSEWEDDAFVNMPVLGCAYQKTFGGTEDQFFIKFDSTGNKLKCFTYIGGPYEDDLDETFHGLSYFNGNIFFAILTLGPGYPVTSNAYQYNPGDTSGIGWSYGDVIIGKLCATSCGDTSNAQPDFTYTSQYCNPAPTQFYGIAAPCDTEGVKYYWQFTGGTPATSTQLNPVSAFSTPGSHIVKFKVITPCSSDSIIKTITLVVASNCNLQATITGGNVCPGNCTNVKVTPTGGVPPYTYVWSPNIGNGPGPYHECPAVTTIYSVTITDNNSNQTTITQTVNVNPVPTFTANSNSYSGPAPQSITFTAQPTGSNIYYHWQCEDHFNVNQNSYTYNFDTAGVYTIFVVATDANGCQTGDTLHVIVTEPVAPVIPSLEVPNIFTPNKDGINDLFFINTKYVNSLTVLIYNRWGQKIYELTNPTQTWDGRTTKGEQCSEGTYYYVLEAKDVLGKEYKQRGFITLIR